MFRLRMPTGGVAATAVVLGLLSGCSTDRIGDPYFADTDSKANVYAGAVQTKNLKIAVLPFKASTELIGSSVSDMTVTELLRTRRYSLVERSQMANVLGEAELALAGLSETKAVEVAKLMGAEAVVIGTVDEYGMQASGGDTYAVVGLAIRLIDCANGRILWSADLAKIAEDEDTPLSSHAREVVHELVAGLYQNLAEQIRNMPPAAPTGVTVSEMGLREATVGWIRPSDPCRCRIERAVVETGPFTELATVPSADGRYTDRSGLRDGAIYYYRLSFISPRGVLGLPSSPVETMTAPPPDAPGGVSAAATSSRCITLGWSAPKAEGLSGYRVERRIAGTGTWKTVATPAAPAFRDGGFAGCDLADSTRYEYRVTALNRIGAVGTPSSPVAVETPPPPAAVTGLTARSREIRCVPLAWNASPEPDVAGYELECAEGKGAFTPLKLIKGRGTTAFLHGHKDPGTLPDDHSYRYRIRAYNSVGSHSDWTEAKAVTKPAPVVPADVAATVDLAGRIRVTWKRNPEPDITEYRVEARRGTGFLWHKVKVEGLAAEETDLDPGAKRTFRVMAVGPKDHQGAWSTETVGAARPLPPAPTDLAVTGIEGGFRITCRPPREGMTGYKLYIKKLIGSEFVAESKAPSFDLAATKAGEKGVDVVVTAIDECGLESEPSAKLSVGR